MILSEFLNKSYRNIDQIYNLIKDKLPIFKDAIYSDPHNIIIPVVKGEYNRAKFAQFNKYLADTLTFSFVLVIEVCYTLMV